jgi:hypothetical protein
MDDLEAAKVGRARSFYHRDGDGVKLNRGAGGFPPRGVRVRLIA